MNIVPMSDLKEMARVMGENKLFGKTPQELLPLMLIAQAEGKHPATSVQEYDIIQGKPALNSRSALSRFQTAGGKIQWLTRTDTEASAEFNHAQGGKLVITWTIERANKSGLTNKDNWKKYPAQMLSARVVAEGVRAIFPACLSGMYLAEEVEEQESKIDESVSSDYEIIEEKTVDFQKAAKEVLEIMNTIVKPLASPDPEKYSEFERLIIQPKELYERAIKEKEVFYLELLKARIEYYQPHRKTEKEQIALDFIEKCGEDYEALRRADA